MNQQLSFLNNENEYISINDAAKSMHVSSASIRNWIKTGYLIQVEKNKVSIKSLELFKENIAGFEKLTNRANKSQKDNHDHETISNSIQSLIKNEENDSSKLGEKYEESLSNSYKNKEGIYYTPDTVTRRFFENLPEDCSDLTFYDPCCGSENFLVAALENGFKPENIYGLDIDPIAIKIAKRRIIDITNVEPKNIICGDFLGHEHQHSDNKYDVIVTNPPWGKKIDKQHREKLTNYFSAGSSKDTSSLFLFACLNKLKNGGTLGLLLQDAFFNIDTFKDARKKVLTFEIIELIDFGKPFKGLITKAKGIVLKKTHLKNSENQVICQSNGKIHYRSQKSFENNSKLTFNFSYTQDDAGVIEHLFAVNHVLLAKNAVFGLGVVTGNNKKHCSSIPKDGLIPAYKGLEIFKDKLGKPSCYISNDFSQYQQVAPMNLYHAKEKLIYRFISSDLVFYHDKNQSLILNSANMLVLNNNFPISSGQLCTLLNSRIINWLFRALFETYKILRSDIESLPIHTKYFDSYSEFSEQNYLKYLGIKEVSIGSFRIKK